MALVEVCSLAWVTRVGHKGDLVLEVISAVVKDGLAQCHNDHLQDNLRLRLKAVTLHLASVEFHVDKYEREGRASPAVSCRV